MMKVLVDSAIFGLRLKLDVKLVLNLELAVIHALYVICDFVLVRVYLEIIGSGYHLRPGYVV
jgi:hypothetical protein